MKTVKTMTFIGVERDSTGKEHIIYRVTCLLCNTILHETHQNCCGHNSSGYGRYKCNCPEETTDEGGL